MKKIIVCLLICLTSITLIGCSKKVDIKDSFSEITKIYFEAKSEAMSCSISVGQRENTYIIDGNHTKNVDFSLITLKFNKIIQQNQIEVELKINDVSSKVELDLNPGNQSYMADLGYALKEDDEIELIYDSQNLALLNASSKFNVNYQQAIDIAINNLGDELNNFYNKGNFKGECYLKVLTLKNSGEDGLFWIFTAVSTERVDKNVIININDGSILVKN